MYEIMEAKITIYAGNSSLNQDYQGKQTQQQPLPLHYRLWLLHVNLCITIPKCAREIPQYNRTLFSRHYRPSLTPPVSRMSRMVVY